MLLKFDEEIDTFNNKKKIVGVIEIAEELRKQRLQLKFTSNLLQKTNHSIEEIAELVDEPVDYVLEVKEYLASTAQAN